MIIDSFIFNGEADILDIRLNILGNSVDRFLIVEAPITFSGIEKPLCFPQQKERFTPWLDKISYVVSDYPSNSTLLALADASKNVTDENWRREFYQRETIRNHIQAEDICFISDVDEIWNPWREYPDGTYKLEQRVYLYHLNNRSSEPWVGTVRTTGHDILNGVVNHLRSDTKDTLPNGGWHFTSIGTPDVIKKKLASYSHQEVNTPAVTSMIEVNMKLNRDLLGRNFTLWVDESDWPQYLKDNRDKYKHLCANS